MQCSSSSRNSATESEHDIEFGSQESDESLEEQSGESPTFPRLFLQLFYFIIVWHITCRITSAVCTLLKFLKFICLMIGTAFNCLPLKTLLNAI